MVGEASEPGVLEPGLPGLAGLADGLAPSLVLVVGTDIADAGVQPLTPLWCERMTASSLRSTSGSSMANRCGCSAFRCPKNDSIQAWSVGGVPGRPKCWAMAHRAMNSRVEPEDAPMDVKGKSWG
jgi:hypothetical protein